MTAPNQENNSPWSVNPPIGGANQQHAGQQEKLATRQFANNWPST